MVLIIFILGTQVIPTNSYLTMDSRINQLDNPSSADLFEGAVSILESRATDSWALPSYSENASLVYYGLIGGIAGIGNNFLNAIDEDTLWIDDTMNARLLGNAVEIGDVLIESGEINTTHATWPVHNLTSEIDLSYDYGISGIVSFFISLYNHTENNTHKTVVEKGLQSIYDLATHDNGMFWEFNSNILYDNYWSPRYDFMYYLPLNGTFTGMSYGSAGFASVAVQYEQMVDSPNTALSKPIIDESLRWIWHQRNESEQELSFKSAEQYIDLYSTSYSTGGAGIGQLYLDLYDHTMNSTYLDLATNIFHWLNGSQSGIRKTSYTWMINGTLDNDREIGSYYGIAGIVDYYMRLDDYMVNSINSSVISAARSLRLYGEEIDNKLQFGERVESNLVRYTGSTSYYLGGGGIFKILNEVGQKYSDQHIIDMASKAKQHLLSSYKSEGDFVAIYNYYDNELENLPLRGISSTLLYLSSLTEGFLDLNLDELNFGSVLIGESKTMTLTLSNLGEGNIDVSWGSISGAFTLNAASINLGIQSTYKLNITFAPDQEMEYTGNITVQQSTNDFVVDLQGFGYDLPSISYSGPENNSMLSDKVPVVFEVSSTDQSGIQSVSISITTESGEALEGGQMVLEDNVYTHTWDYSNLVNGTYHVDLVSEDTVGKVSSIHLEYQVGIYVPSIQDQAFSTTTIIILSTIAGILIVGSVILVKKYSG